MAYSDYDTPDTGYRYTRWGAVAEIDDITGTRAFSYRTTLDLQLESEQTSVSGVPSGGISLPKKRIHSYDSLGRRTRHRVGAPDGSTSDHAVQYGYDPHIGRLATIVHGDSTLSLPEKTFTQSYRVYSNLPETLTGPLHETVREWETYRDTLRSISSTAPGAGGTNFLTVAFDFPLVPGNGDLAVNGIGQRTTAHYSGEVSESLFFYPEGVSAAGTYTYGYNANGELVSQTGGRSHGYQYDPIGNRLSASAAGSTVATYKPNALNQYDWIDTGSGPLARSHDEDGNLEHDGTKIYGWDAENRLVSVKRASDNQPIAGYAYDYMGRRIHKQTTAIAPQGASETVFLYDGWNLSAEYAVSGSPPSALHPQRTYTWGLDLSGTLQGAGGVGGLLAFENKDLNSSSQGVYYPLYDGNGNVLGTLKDTGNSTAIAGAYHYDPFGKTLLSAGDYGGVNPFRFSTKYFDGETGFYYYGYRHYDPATGRWPSRDPLGDFAFYDHYTMSLDDSTASHLYQESLGMPYSMINNQAVNKYDVYGLAGPAIPAAAAVVLLKALDLAAGCVCGLYIWDMCALYHDVGYFFGSGGNNSGLFQGFTPEQIECITGALTAAAATPPGTGAVGSAVGMALTVPVCGATGFIKGAINYGGP